MPPLLPWAVRRAGRATRRERRAAATTAGVKLLAPMDAACVPNTVRAVVDRAAMFVLGRSVLGEWQVEGTLVILPAYRTTKLRDQGGSCSWAQTHSNHLLYVA